MAQYETAESKVRWLGAARNGTEHFWRQRLTAVANIVLVAAVATIMFALVGQPYEEARAWMSRPLIGLVVILFGLNAALHLQLGLQVVIEDYIHKDGSRWALMALSIGLSAAAAVGFAYAVILITL